MKDLEALHEEGHSLNQLGAEDRGSKEFHKGRTSLKDESIEILPHLRPPLIHVRRPGPGSCGGRRNKWERSILKVLCVKNYHSIRN